MHTIHDMRRVVLETKAGQHLWIATDILRALGVRMPTSRSPQYRLAARTLDQLASEGYLQKRYIPSVNVTVFWRIP